MINKTKLTKTSIFISLMMGLSLWFAWAVNFNLNMKPGTTLSLDNFVSIHFADNNNNFGWLIYFANVDTVWDGKEAVVIKWDNPDDSTSYKCKWKVSWFYYNSERWERLWPLDDKTKTAWDMNVDIQGWLYTRCEKEWYREFVDECESEAKKSAKNKLRDENGYAADYEPTDAELDELDEFIQENKDQCIEAWEWEYKDDYSYYGTIIHTYQGQNFGLVAWVEYDPDTSNNKWISVKSQWWLSRSFQRYDNKYPVGLIYDYNWWLGFVWCKVQDTNTLRNIIWKIQTEPTDWNQNPSISDLFMLHYDEEEWKYSVVPKNEGGSIGLDSCGVMWWAWSSLVWMIVEWLVGMSNESESGIIGGQGDNSKMQYFWSANINNATLINFVRQRAGVLCRWKWQSSVTAPETSDNVVCIDLSDQNVVVEVDASASMFQWKTLVVKGEKAEVVVKANTTDNQEYKYDIFVDGWTLKIDNTAPKEYVFKYNWFISDTTPEEFDVKVAQALQTNCNEGMCTYEWDEVAVWALLKWNFIVKWKIGNRQDNTVIDKKYFVYWKFNTDSSTEDLYDLFAWRCEYWQWSNWGVIREGDSHRCPPSSSTYPHPYQNASLVIIDQDYASPLFW